jgi:hypothetical protein
MLIIAALGLEDGVPVRRRLSLESAPVNVGLGVVVELQRKVEAVKLFTVVVAVVISAVADGTNVPASTSIREALASSECDRWVRGGNGRCVEGPASKLPLVDDGSAGKGGGIAVVEKDPEGNGASVCLRPFLLPPEAAPLPCVKPKTRSSRAHWSSSTTAHDIVDVEELVVEVQFASCAQDE